MSHTDALVGEERAVLREGAVIFLLGLSIVLVIMNTMMFNLALPAVSADFGIAASSASWIVTGYSIVFAISSIAGSRLSDFVPIRRLFMIGIVLLGVAAIAGFFSNRFVPLLIARLLQALGAGSIPSLSLVLVTRYVPLERRGKAMAALMSASSLGFGLGPVVGGAIVQYLGWHALFAVTSLTLLLAPLFAALLPKEAPGRGTFDWPGALFIGAGSTGLLLFLTNRSWTALAAGLAALVLFARRIRRAENPFVEPALFRHRPYLMLGAVGIAVYMCGFAALFLLPQILDQRFGLSALATGIVIFPGSLLSFMLSRWAGKMIDRYGNGPFIRFSPLLTLSSVVLFALFASVSYIAVLFVYMLMSVGFTLLMSSISNEMSRMLPASQIGSGLGLYQLLQFFSGAFGAAAAASALVWQLKFSLSFAYGTIFWGMAFIVLAAIGCAHLYLRDLRDRGSDRSGAASQGII